MKKINEIINERLNILGITAQAAAKKVGLQPNFIHDIVREKKKAVSPHSVNQVAEALNWSIEEYYAATLPSFGESLATVKEKSKPTYDPQIPVLGVARGGEFDQWQMIEQPSQFVKRPTGLEGVEDAYAVLVVGDSMSPAIRSGTTAVVNPKLRPQTLDLVVIQIEEEDGTLSGLVKELFKQTEQEIIVQQYHPELVKLPPISRHKIKAIHVISHIVLRDA